MHSEGTAGGGERFRHGWLLAEGAARTFRRFRDDWRAQPDAARRALLWTLLVGLAAAAALMLGTVFFVRHLDASGALAWEAPALRRVERIRWFSFATALWAESPGNSVFMIPIVLCAALLAAWMRRPLRALAILASFFMLDLIVLTGWLAWNRARPHLIAGGIAAPGLHSFPSGHLSQMLATYGLFTWMWMRGSRSAAERALSAALLAIAVAVVCLARMRLGAHWPTDLMTGAGLGIVWLGVVMVALRRAERAGGR
jgi:undecaprenyl-diphosphatase